MCLAPVGTERRRYAAALPLIRNILVLIHV
jgi:hypothetical protein